MRDEKCEMKADDIANCVRNWWESPIANTIHKRIPENSWSVLAAIVLERKVAVQADKTTAGQQQGNNTSTSSQSSAVPLKQQQHAEVVAIGVGTQCVGRKKLDKNGHVLHDSHAEILAKRSFQRYLALEVQQINNKLPDEQQTGNNKYKSEKLEWNPETKKYRLGDDWKVHLYSSQSPCGDAAIYPVYSDAEAAVDNQEKSASVLDGGGDGNGPPAKRVKRITGAKPLFANTETMSEQSINSLRTKPGKSTMAEPDRTYSMSCSDKIASWNVHGLQGALLSQTLDPIYLFSVTVTHDTQTTEEDQRSALERGVCERVRHFPMTPKDVGMGYQNNHDCLCQVSAGASSANTGPVPVRYPFLRPGPDITPSTSWTPKPSPLCFNWCRDGFSPSSGEQKTIIETTLGTHGLRQGVNLKVGHTATTRSRLSKSAALERSVVAMSSNALPSALDSNNCNSNAAITTTYIDFKKKEPSPYSVLKKRFRDDWFKTWVVTPLEHNRWVVVSSPGCDLST
jgi:hypothetical protein